MQKQTGTSVMATETNGFILYFIYFNLAVLIKILVQLKHNVHVVLGL